MKFQMLEKLCGFQEQEFKNDELVNVGEDNDSSYEHDSYTDDYTDDYYDSSSDSMDLGDDFADDGEEE